MIAGKKKFSVEREFYFEAAHRLSGKYQGKCRNLHGHSFKVNIRVDGVELDQNGILVDFKEIKLLNKWVDEHLDHAVLLNKEDELLDYLNQHGKTYTFDSNPTSETLAKFLFNKAEELLIKESSHKVAFVKVNETCTCAATYWGK